MSSVAVTESVLLMRERPAPAAEPAEFWPRAPKSLQEARLSESDVDSLVLKFLLVRGQALGREVAEQLRLPFGPISELLRRLKTENLVTYKSASLNDYVCEPTAAALDRARRLYERSSYFGSAPVAFSDYLASVDAQSLRKQRPTAAAFRASLKDLLIPEEMLLQLGQAVCSGRGMFLFGMPGNGKTSIAERVCATFGTAIWIPRAVDIDGEIVRVFDPTMHEEAPLAANVLDPKQVDQRWVRVKRPTIVAGGELTLDNLELTRVPSVGILEAALQMKSNCGTLVIDDLGRQRIRPDELLNRWIIPLERGYDFLNTPGGKKLRMPFDQLIIFSTNLKPEDLVDEAFLRRIPYKVRVTDPSEPAFVQLFERMAKSMGIAVPPNTAQMVLEKHYRPVNRPLRCCHARDILAQVRDFCLFQNLPLAATPDALNAAIRTYFGTSV